MRSGYITPIISMNGETSNTLDRINLMNLDMGLVKIFQLFTIDSNKI